MTSFNQIKNSVIGFYGKSFGEWFDTHLEFNLKEQFEYLLANKYEECSLQEYIQEVYRDDYIDDICDGKQFSFYRYLQDNQHNYKASVFINVWIDCCKWYLELYGEKLELLSHEQAWNSIACWIIKEYLQEDWEELFIEKFEEEYMMYKDNKTKPSRIACGVCFENKLIYTGCSTCKGNYLCYTCYTRLNNDNECPFCRNPEMILNIQDISATNDVFSYSVVPDLMRVLESRIIN